MRDELANKQVYRASIGGIRLRLPELQGEDQMARKIREKGLKEGWEEINGVLHREGCLYQPKIIRTEIISRHHNDPLTEHFGVEKTRELVARKYYWSTLQDDINAYIKGCNICILSKIVKHKAYDDLHSLPVPIHY